MFRMMRALFTLSLVGACGIVFFTALMFAAKIWGIYCVAPGEGNIKGSTLIITVYEDEPFLNSSDRPIPQQESAVTQPQPRGMFGSSPIKRMSVQERTVVKLPYLRWLHMKAKDTTSS